MKKNKLIMLLTILCLCTLPSMSAFASAGENQMPTIQPYSIINYGSFYLSGGGTRYLTDNGGNFIIQGGQTVSVTYNASVSLNVYFHNSSTGRNTRIFTSYTPNSSVSGYFYITNPTSSSVYVSNVSVSY